MANRFSSGKNSIAECDRCGFQFKLKQLKREVIKTKNYELLVCGPCWDPDQPQLQLGMYPVDDPQGVRNPRPDTTYYSAGTTGLQTIIGATDEDGVGLPSGGSRVFQWGWAPVGGSRLDDDGLTPNYLALTVEIGTVAVEVT